MADKRKKDPSGGTTQVPIKKHDKLGKKGKAANRKATGADAKKPSQELSPLADEERKAKKNAYIREWRKAHKDDYAAYMKAWREKKAKAEGKAPAKKRTSSRKLTQESPAPGAAMPAGSATA